MFGLEGFAVGDGAGVRVGLGDAVGVVVGSTTGAAVPQAMSKASRLKVNALMLHLLSPLPLDLGEGLHGSLPISGSGHSSIEMTSREWRLRKASIAVLKVDNSAQDQSHLVAGGVYK